MLRQTVTRARIVVLGAEEAEPLLMACVRAGVSGFVGPDGSAHDLVTAIHAAVRGELVCTPRLAGMLLHRVISLTQREAAPQLQVLTPREQQILGSMEDGLSNKQIARRLGIRDATVKSHVHSILGKLGVRRRGEAVARLRNCPASCVPEEAP